MISAGKILIIEDDDFLLRMYSTKLEMEGFEIIAAPDGEKGIKQAVKEKPNLILLDLLLPKKDGFQVLKEIRENPETKNLPVIILTNLSQKKDIDRCYQLGISDYLIKAHFVPSEVIFKIKRVLDGAI